MLTYRQLLKISGEGERKTPVNHKKFTGVLLLCSRYENRTRMPRLRILYPNR